MTDSPTPDTPPAQRPPDDEEEESHEIVAMYRLQPDGTPYGKHMPALDCSCGFWTQQCDTWEDAGIDMDRHLMMEEIHA